MDVLFFSLLLLIFLSILHTYNNRKRYKAARYAQEMQQEIDFLHEEWSDLRQKIANNALSDKTNNLPHVLDQVLQRYFDLNIRIPLDIIEEAARLTWTDETEVIAYIEQQRNHWKLECQKKGLK
jgi:hypothetical protein